MKVSARSKKEAEEIEENYQDLILKVPNIAFDEVPVGKDEFENVVSKKVGEPTKFNFTPKLSLDKFMLI